MSEHPFLNYEQTRGPEGTRLSDGAEFDLQKSKLGTPEQGRALADAARIAETVTYPDAERHPIYGHEEAILSTQYVLGVRNAELLGSDTLVLGRREDYDKAA